MARTILITGCSSGIGHHAAETLAARGWRVFATCRSEADCERLRAAGLESLRLDYSDGDSIAAAFAAVMERSGGRLDALFNNGAFALPGAIEDVPVAGLRDIFETNVFGWHDLTCRAVAVMRRQGHGRIIQNSSIVAYAALPMRGAYNATKYAIAGLTDTLRLELHGTGIHVILLEPGLIRTEIRIKSRPHFERWIDWRNSPWRARYEQRLMPRLYAVDEKPARFERTCAATSAVLIRALDARRPAAHYPVTVPTHVLAMYRRLLPTRMLDALLYWR